MLGHRNNIHKKKKKRVKDKRTETNKTWNQNNYVHHKSEQLEWRHLSIQAPTQTSKNKKNVLRNVSSGEEFTSQWPQTSQSIIFGAFMEKISPFVPAWIRLHQDPFQTLQGWV